MSQELSHVGMSRCFYCMDFADVLLDTRIVGGELRKSLPRDCGVLSMDPCTKCEGYMKEGIILIGYDETKTDFEQIERDRLAWRTAHDQCHGHGARGSRFEGMSYERQMRTRNLDPWCFIPRDVYRTGQFAVVRENFITSNPFPDDVKERALKARFVFLPEEIMKPLCEEVPA